MVTPIHLYITDKLLVLTQNKVASRYVSALLYPHSTDSTFHVESNFKISESHIEYIELYSNQNNVKVERVIDEYNSIFNNTCNKNILFLYRNPFDRIFSGIIQEFHSAIYSTVNEYYDFKLKFILKNHYNCESLYDKLLSQKLWYNGDFDNSDGFFSESEKSILSNLLLYYIFYFSNTEITNTDHTYNYLKSLYNILHNDSMIDLSNVNIINISDDINLISTYCEMYHNLQYDVPVNSNKFMKDLLSSEYLDSNSIELLNDSFERIKKSISAEQEFYDKLIKSNLNFKLK